MADTPKFATGSSSTWKNIALIALGGIAVASTTMLVIQWRPAALGRHVQGDVLNFLKANGSVVSDRVVSGGVVVSPMPIQEAVANTVGSLLQNMNAAIRKRSTVKPKPQPEVEDDEPQYEVSGGGSKKPKQKQSEKPINPTGMPMPGMRDDDDVDGEAVTPPEWGKLPGSED